MSESGKAGKPESGKAGERESLKQALTAFFHVTLIFKFRLFMPFSKMMNMVLLFAGLILLRPDLLFPQALPISIDGEFDDWDDAVLLYEFQADTASVNDDLQITRLWGANDDRFLFLRFELNQEVTLLENNPLVLLLDTDNDSNTGYAGETIGAELKWEFGQRRGVFYSSDSDYNIRFDNIRLRTAPSVSSQEFEIAIGRQSAPNNINPLFRSDTVRIYLRTSDGEWDTYVQGTYVFDPESVPDPDPIPLERFHEDDLRVLGFNSWDDKLFEPGQTNQYRRILMTLDPDIIAFQEIWDHSAAQTAQRVGELLPAGDGFQWEAVKMDNGNVTVSRFPIMESWRILSRRRLTASLVDTREKYGSKILIINVHFRCCASGEEDRWQEIAALAEFFDDAREPGGRLHLEEDTPVVIVGDFNLVGSRDQLAEITSSVRDWDGSGIDMVRARQTEKRMHYTWRNDQSTFSPGKLDYIFYTESALQLQNHYTLKAETMSTDERERYGLMYGDTRDASDHLPQVADFVFPHHRSTDLDNNRPRFYGLHQNYPNPFNDTTQITFELQEPTLAYLAVKDVLGRKITTLVNGSKIFGRHTVTWNAEDIASGVYMYILKAGDYSDAKKMLLLK